MKVPTGSFIVPGTPSSPAYGNLFDLARMQRGADAEICDNCHTIHLGHARLCKSCAHKLPAFYESTPPTGPLVRAAPPVKQALALDLFAFGLVINALAFVMVAGVPLA